ncbi:hypothetical protein K431DRAFT_285592 [Polychaeton citri CBS 116435]|uniref:NTF2-like domain-containing protein n=1 Tax=Polychaeton citri CBS 116435 TaxID=1314669 RepID=A0A9P4Q9R7_9PEZI|nr:hypothetical protein K431DRAFT_285592 [Polychaeton citri CBS 116435]
MQFTIFSLLLLAANALAGLTYLDARGGGGRKCLSESTAQQVASNFFTITGGQGIFNRTVAEAALANDFSDTSGSVSSIVNGGNTGPLPLLGPTFANKEDFINANAQQPQTQFKQLNLYFTCNTVIQRFVASPGSQPALGISIFEVIPAPKGNLYPFQIKQVYGELNSAAWLVDIGVFVPASSSR